MRLVIFSVDIMVAAFPYDLLDTQTTNLPAVHKGELGFVFQCESLFRYLKNSTNQTCHRLDSSLQTVQRMIKTNVPEASEAIEALASHPGSG